MASRDPRVDAYIEKQAAFARPILEHLRAAIHRTSPDAEETIKWGMPFFTLNGQPLANMGAFKAHASFGFWRGRELTGAGEDKDGMGQFGKLASIADLPDEAALDALIRQAAALIESGAKKPRPAREAKPPLEMPADLAEALAASSAAQACYDRFPLGQKREYLEWVMEAKRPETRARRIAQAVEWMAEGKTRNWKYESC